MRGRSSSEKLDAINLFLMIFSFTPLTTQDLDKAREAQRELEDLRSSLHQAKQKMSEQERAFRAALRRQQKVFIRFRRLMSDGVSGAWG